MRLAPSAPWIVLAAWLGTMFGVGAALRPTLPQPLAGVAAEAQQQAWQRVAAAAPRGVHRLWLGGVPCGCDDDAVLHLQRWARATGVAVGRQPGVAGVALVDAEGRLRYAGEAAALVLHCAGRRGFEAWWTGGASRPVLTAPCPCA